MSATKLVLHHRYRRDVAYDWSRHANHGQLVSVSTGGGSAPLSFANDDARVEVAPSPSFRGMGELRVRAVFRPQDGHESPRRYNLVEGELAFALFRENDGSLMGTVRSPSAGWIGARSAPWTVRSNQWHVADLVYDGISHVRLYLDGVLVGERWNAAGPLRRELGARGVWIGHWPGDGRYTFRGELDQVQIWTDDPHEDADRVVDDCCIDLPWLDERVAEARRRGWGPEATVESFSDLADLMRAAAAEVRGDSAARADQIGQHTQQAMNALAVGDGPGLMAPIAALRSMIDGQLGAARANQLGQELLDALRATPVGIWAGKSVEELIDFAEEVARHGCLDGLIPPPGKQRPPERPDVDPDRPQGDPDTDGDPRPDPKPSGEKPEDPPDDHIPPKRGEKRRP